MAGTAQGGDGYILARTEAEYARLRAQARAFQEATERVLDKAGLAQGMSCLDVGSGPGEVMRLMARRVGPRGRVHGLDADRPLGEYMLGELRRSEPGEFAFHAGDAMAEDTLPDARFDFVFARLLLIHMTDPVAALKRLWGWVAPSGTLAVMDYDMTTAGSFPPQPAARRAGEIIRETFRASGKRDDIGSWMPSLFGDAGIGPVAGIDVSGLMVEAARFAPMTSAVLRSLADPAVKLGVTSEAELAEILGDLARLGEAGNVYYRWPLMIGVWAKKEA